MINKMKMPIDTFNWHFHLLSCQMISITFYHYHLTTSDHLTDGCV